jgi:caffeoyl-CoA O-methyltransferase
MTPQRTCLVAGPWLALLLIVVGGPAACERAPVSDRASGMSPSIPSATARPADCGGDLPAGITAVLDAIRARDAGLLAVSEEDGRFLRVLVATSGARQALEIGGASGYSAIWIGLGLRETGGRLTTLEYDAARAAEAAVNIERAGLSDIVRVVAGDAFAEIPKLEGSFDFVFLDAWKRDYARFFDLVLPRMTPGSLFVAHNVVNKRDEMADFLAAIQDNRALLTAIVAPSGEGVSVSYKRR